MKKKMICCLLSTINNFSKELPYRIKFWIYTKGHVHKQECIFLCMTIYALLLHSSLLKYFFISANKGNLSYRYQLRFNLQRFGRCTARCAVKIMINNVTKLHLLHYSIYLHIHMKIWREYINIYIYIYICMYVCMYIHLYIFLNTQTYI